MITTNGLSLQKKVCEYKGKFVITTERWWSTHGCAHDRRFVNPTGLWVQQNVGDYKGKGLLLQGTRLVITRDSLRLHGEGVCKGEVGDHYGKVRDYKG